MREEYGTPSRVHCNEVEGIDHGPEKQATSAGVAPTSSTLWLDSDEVAAAGPEISWTEVK